MLLPVLRSHWSKIAFYTNHSAGALVPKFPVGGATRRLWRHSGNAWGGAGSTGSNLFRNASSEVICRRLFSHWSKIVFYTNHSAGALVSTFVGRGCCAPTIRASRAVVCVSTAQKIAPLL